MNIPTFIILALAVYRITHLIVFDKIFEPIRKHFVTRGFDGQNITYTLQGGFVRRYIGKIINCYWCTGIWASAGFVYGLHANSKVTTFIACIFALAAFAAITETFLLKSVGMPLEMKEVSNEIETDDLGPARGIINGLLLSIPLWAIIISIFMVIRRWI
jgi:hypothetical protein